jgi:hypothetical protein
MFEIGSCLWLLVGLILLQRGAAALKVQWFALFLSALMLIIEFDTALHAFENYRHRNHT